MAAGERAFPGVPADAVVRAFLAILVPQAEATLEELRSDPDLLTLPVRWLAPEGLHVTLAFLGESPARTVAAAWPAIAQAVAATRPAPLVVLEPELFPDARRPRLVVAPVRDERAVLQQLQAALVDVLADTEYPLEDRTFRPHVSLGRLRPPLLRGQAAEIAAALRARRWSGGGAVTAESVCLMRSDLFPDGARYTVLAQAAMEARS